MAPKDYHQTAREVGLDLSALSARARTQVINAMAAKYNEGYVAGYNHALNEVFEEGSWEENR
jgi:hypothetical protein